MSGMTIVAIVLVFCMLVGPILMLKPSVRQRQLAQLRAKAPALGLKVQTGLLLKKPYTAYVRPWPTGTNRRFTGPAWVLARRDYEHDIHLAQWWDTVEGERPAGDVASGLTPRLQQLPKSAVGCSASAQGVALYWLEQGGEAELQRLAEWLDGAVNELWPHLSETPPQTPATPDHERANG